MLAGVAFAAFLGSVFWAVTYLSFIEERRSIEGRLSELRGQALRTGSTLACLEHTGESVRERLCANAVWDPRIAGGGTSLHGGAA